MEPGYWNPPIFVGCIPKAILEFVFQAGAKGRWKRKDLRMTHYFSEVNGCLKHDVIVR